MLLAIDTAARPGTVAVWPKGATSVAAVETLGDRDTAGTLAPAVARLIETYGPPSAYALDVGPGSFTGLRIGLAFVKGLARGRPAPALGLGSTEIIAADVFAKTEAEVAVGLLSASGGLVFAGGHLRDGSAWEALPVGLYSPEELRNRLEGHDGIALGGEGMSRLELPSVLRAEVGGPRAETLARLAAERFSAGAVPLDLSALEPAYHQLSAAEARLREREAAARLS